MTDASPSPTIDAVPLKHPWRWVAAGVIIVLLGLFLWGAATNDAYGWETYAKYLLQFERGNAYAPGLQNQLRKVRKIASLERSDRGGSMMGDPDFRRKLSEVEIKVEALNATELRIFAGRANGEAMGAVSSMLKLEGKKD